MVRFLFCGWWVLASLSAADWPRWMGPDGDGVWREDGVLERFPDGGPKILWRSPVGSGYAGPAVAGGRVFVMDRVLEDQVTQRVQERLWCLDEGTGQSIWMHGEPTVYTAAYPAGPRATPTVDGDRIYTVGTEGRLQCLAASSGEVLWSKDYRADYGAKTPTWGFAAAPLVDGDQIICLVGGPGAVVVSFDKRTGEENWWALSAREPGYCAPCLVEYAGNRQLLVWHPEALNALDPATGDVLWSVPWEIRAGLTIPMPRIDGDRLFLTAFYNGSLMLRLQPDGSRPEILWRTMEASERRTTHLNSIMSTPVLHDGHIYGVCSYGQFRCLEMETGRRVWEDLTLAVRGDPVRWGNVFLTPHRDRFFLFNENGELLIARLTPAGPEVLGRAHILEPNGVDLRQRPIVWSHPAYANRKCFARNDTEIVCVDLAAPSAP